MIKLLWVKLPLMLILPSLADLANPNTYILENTTPGAFIFNWELGNGTKKEGAKVSAFYQKKGDYVVVLTVANAGGHKKVEKPFPYLKMLRLIVRTMKFWSFCLIAVKKFGN
jgi:hypothetical protein